MEEEKMRGLCEAQQVGYRRHPLLLFLDQGQNLKLLLLRLLPFSANPNLMEPAYNTRVRPVCSVLCSVGPLDTEQVMLLGTETRRDQPL